MKYILRITNYSKQTNEFNAITVAYNETFYFKNGESLRFISGGRYYDGFGSKVQSFSFVHDR